MNESSHNGFDAPVKRREDDHLDRWPLAREIYGIAVTGPKDWSIRIGVYGEWGTGKTSVLEFIGRIATAHEHLVIKFNPWEHSIRAELWRAFVSTILEAVKARFGKLKGVRRTHVKNWVVKAKEVLPPLARTVATVNKEAGKAVEAGLDLVKNFCAFSKADLKPLQDLLGDKRVIVLIDDLDRTAPELVPEILFALKELMDVPEFSFICAFDPVVVGKVLR